MTNFSDPITSLLPQLAERYASLLQEFISKIKMFLFLEENEIFQAENMSIKCINKEIYDDEQIYFFWWYHSNKSESHLINLVYSDDEWFFNFESSVYKIPFLEYSDLIKTDARLVYEYYICLYYADAFFEQLIIELKK